MAQTDELRIFISSTFRDMEAEREHLLRRIFPEIRALCRLRGVTFTEIDLRWGLTDEEATLGRVIRTCLEEIDRCRQYFVGIIGGRYGWIPEYHEVLMDPQLGTAYPQVEQMALEGKSITEIEFAHGALEHEGERVGTIRFYRRRGEPNSAEDGEKIAALVQRVDAAGFPIREYDSVEEFGRMARAGLIETIDRFWPVEDAPDEHERENRAHHAFARSRRRAYVPDAATITRFMTWLAGSEPPLLIQGESGLGKSALTAFLVETFRRKHPDGVVIEHYIGAAERSGKITDVIRHIIGETIATFGLEETVPSDRTGLVTGFPGWLFRLAHLAAEEGRPILVAVDGLDHLPESDLTIVPDPLPDNLRLILSTKPGPGLDQLQERQVVDIPLDPIDDERRRQSIIIRYLGEFHKGISAAQLARIVADGNSPSPLFLRLVSEELRLQGDHETLDAAIDRLLGSEDITGAFTVFLERLEKDFGVDVIRGVLSLLAIAETGLSEVEILGSSNLTRLELSALLPSLDYHLIWSDGLLSFHHDVLRHAVEQRYFENEEYARTLRRRIVDFLRKQPAGSRTIFEVLPQLEYLGETTTIVETLSRPDFLLATASEFCFEVLPWWNRTSNLETMADVYGSIIRRQVAEIAERYRTASERGDMSGETEESFDLELRIVVDAMILLMNAGRPHRALEVHEEIRRILFDLLPEDHQLMLRIEYSRLRSEWDVGKESGIVERLTDYVRILERSGSTPPKLLNDTRNFLAVVLQSIGEYVEAERILRTMIASDNLPFSTLSHALTNLAQICFFAGRLDESERNMREALAMKRRTLGTDHPETAEALNNLAAILHRRDDATGAYDLMQEVVTIRTNVFGEDHIITLRARMNLGLMLLALDRLTEAEEIMRPLLPLAEDRLEPNHKDLFQYHISTIALLRKLERFHEAENLIGRTSQLIDCFDERSRLTMRTTLRYEQAHLLYCRGEKENGMDVLDELLTLDPEEHSQIAGLLATVSRMRDAWRQGVYNPADLERDT